MAEWSVIETDADIQLMAKVLKTSPIVARVLANRGVRSKHAAIRYLFPKKEYLLPTNLMKDAETACEILRQAIELRTPIAIYGDYDVDGVTSTTILYKALNGLGANVTYYIPHREQGYGLNIPAVRELYQGGTRLLLTCDNGIASIAEVEEAKRLGMEVIIIDHHEPGFTADANGGKTDLVPAADAIVDPKQRACSYPFKHLCAAGICYKFVVMLYQHCGARLEQEAEQEYLIFAAIATFCDIVDLKSENRIIARLGLDLCNGEGRALNRGLRELIKQRGLEEKQIGAFEIGFVIGPTINAAGRLERATLAVELFTCEDEERVTELAARLSALNDMRKSLTNTASEQTLALLEEQGMDNVLVLYNPEVHESVAGIVAGRIKDRTNHPVVLLTNSVDEGLVKGSARSISGYNIFEALYENKSLFERFGGHGMAAGLTLKQENVGQLRRNLNDACVLTEQDFVPQIQADAELVLDDITASLSQQLDILEPFGKGNGEPLFVTRDAFARDIAIIGESRTHLRMSFQTRSGRTIKGVAFNLLERFIEVVSGRYSQNVVERIRLGDLKGLTIKLDILYYIDINEYNGNKFIQLKINDFN